MSEATKVPAGKSPTRGSKPGERRGGRVAGTPNKATADVKAIAQEYVPAAILKAARLAGLIQEMDKTTGEMVVVGEAESEQARIAALNIILDRACGKPTTIIAGDEEAPPVKTVMEVTYRIVDPKHDDDRPPSA